MEGAGTWQKIGAGLIGVTVAIGGAALGPVLNQLGDLAKLVGAVQGLP